MNENDLIDKLSSELKPSPKLESVPRRFFKWFLVVLLCVGAGLSLVGIREDWSVVFLNPLLLLQNISIFLGVIAAALAAIVLSIPGNSNKSRTLLWVSIPFIVWTLTLLLRFFMAPELHPRAGLGCASEICVLAAIPALILFYFVGKGASLFRGISGFLILLAASGVGAWSVQFTCHNDDPAHIFVWHFLPVIILGSLGVYLGKALIKKI